MDEDFQKLKAIHVAQQAQEDQRLAAMTEVLERTALVDDGVDELQLRLFEGMVAQWALMGGLKLVAEDQLRFLDEYERRQGR